MAVLTEIDGQSRFWISLGTMTLRGRLSFIFPLFVLFILFAFYSGKNFSWLNFRENFRERLAKIDIAGEIADLSDGSPLEMVTVRVGSGVTYTNYRGQFHWEGLRSLPAIAAESPDGYERKRASLSCREKASPTFFRRLFSCAGTFVPTPETMVFRILDAEVIKGAEEEREIDDRYNFLWSWVHPEQKPFLGSWAELRPIFKTRERIFKKLKKATVSFGKVGETVYLPSWTEPVSGKTYGHVAEINIRRKDLKGRVSEAKEHLARGDNGVWYYFLPLSRAGLVDYVEANSWVLRIRD